MSSCGVCSISFRKYSVEEIIDAAKAAGLDGIEWGSDIHVPPKDKELARQVRKKMDAAGLVTLSYGTYFGIEELELDGFEDYLETAEILGTDTLRIWPPRKSRQEISLELYETYVSFSRKVALQAKAKGKLICLERHPHMLTESAYEAKQFLADVGMDNFRMYWQPVQYVDNQTNLDSACLLADSVERLHVFYWRGENRYPLEEGDEIWQKYAGVFERRENKHTVYLLEFMPDDRLSTLEESARTLREIVQRAIPQKQTTTVIMRPGTAAGL